MKLLWLSDRLHLNKFGRLILKDNYNALPHGPVPTRAMDFSKSSVEDFYSVSKFNIKANKETDNSYFSKSDVEILEQVWNQFGSMNQFDLRDFSHNFPEWLRYKSELENPVLPKSYSIIIDDFFNNPEGVSLGVNISSEEINHSKEYYHSFNSIQSHLNG